MKNIATDIRTIDVSSEDYASEKDGEFFVIDPDDDINMKVKTAAGTIGRFTFRPGNAYALSVIYADVDNDRTTLQIAY